MEENCSNVRRPPGAYEEIVESQELQGARNPPSCCNVE
ncbi:unnamed protein product [Phyllotreta striolata]|uniref:Uncharacterized protein n=1 Tax=Phyllotreta striolata TaxID=444603 RepID=A0A9N9TND8_PHYSR|nr:unnamed protein product [Phyllotreta striolata]